MGVGEDGHTTRGGSGELEGLNEHWNAASAGNGSNVKKQRAVG